MAYAPALGELSREVPSRKPPAPATGSAGAVAALRTPPRVMAPRAEGALAVPGLSTIAGESVSDVPAGVMVVLVLGSSRSVLTGSPSGSVDLPVAPARPRASVGR